jgi:hypothetical protein
VSRDADSREIAELRAAYLANERKLRSASRQRGIELRRATPYRLGSFATITKITITDFGAHSKRWVDLFHRGREGKA